MSYFNFAKYSQNISGLLPNIIVLLIILIFSFLKNYFFLEISTTAQILPTITINQGNLREINDPVLGMITVMHKLGYLSQESSFKNDISLEYKAIQYIVKR